MSEPKLKLQKSFPSVLVIDDARIDVRVKRMTNREFDDYAKQFKVWGEQKHEPVDPSLIPFTDEEKAEGEEANRAWIRASLDSYLEIVAGQIDDAGHDVTRGGELLDLFGGRVDVVPQAMALIMVENNVSEKKKEASRSALVSALGLGADTSGGNGNEPAPIADAAARPTSVDLAVVTAPSNGASSGTTVQ